MNTLFLSSLSLHAFRNYAQLRMEVAPEPVVLFGHNGAGKTNILEAISLLLPGRGLRRAALSELLRYDNENWAIVVNMNGIKGEVTLATGRDMENVEAEKRIVKIDGKQVPQAHFAQHASILWLTPQMEQLFLEGASEGRKFLDRLVYGFDADHASHVNAYESAMRERNRLLEQDRADAVWLSALEKTMSEKAAIIASSRLATLERLNNVITASALSFPKPRLAVAGVVEDMFAAGDSSLAAEMTFVNMLAENRAADAAAGRTLIGTHRSELVVTHKIRGMPARQCSTGEQKALMLSITLAQSRAIAEARGWVPMILLDEVVAHLDPDRRIELFAEIIDTKAQVWMSGTDARLFEGIRSAAQFFQVENGRITLQGC